MITHLSRVISVRDLVQQVKDRCPVDTPVPSNEWVRLQFWPSSCKSSLRNTGKFKIRLMVQKRRWRNEHIDSHYGAAYFRLAYV